MKRMKFIFKRSLQNFLLAMTLCNASSCGSFETVNSSTDDGESLPSLDDRHIAVIVIQSGVMAVIMLLSVLGNSLVLAAIYRDGQLKNTASVYVANLAIADFLNGALAMPFILTCSTVGRWPFGAFICSFVGALTTLFCSVSVFTLGTIAIDRYLAILHPLQYNAVMTRSKIIFSIALTWLHAVVLSALPIMGWSTYAYIDMEYICTADWGGTLSYTLTVFAIDLGFPVTTMFFCYYHVLKTARKHSRQVASCQVGPAGVNGCPRERCFCQSWRRLKSEMKAAITLLAVIGTFLFCWLPHVVTMVCLSRPHNCHFPDAVFAITTWLAMANSACNPLIYGILNRQFRQAFRDILCVWKARRLFSR
ncbi:octopamine receptor beta-2R-like [Acanthaster planci]|uniref:Octopamine receptor beta-2R-like n=1 Tax=Acanthaster planci TaxID=133434 RepID=A0A8B7ZKZ0_ACAPL|nr:octopamine receptor beta-2R-like [Acanthaster planci]